MKKNTTLLLTLSLFFVLFKTQSQQIDTLNIKRNDQGIITFLKFNPNKERTMASGNFFLKKVLKLEQKEDFLLQKEKTDKYGITHQRYQQYYNGIKVEGAEYLVHGKNRIVETINGDYRKVGIMSTSPKLAEQQALEKARAYVNAKIYKWEDEAMEQLLKKNTGNPNATYYPTGELIIVKDVIKDKGNLKLAWKFTISSLSPNNEQLIYIDAGTGDVIGDTPLLVDANTPGTAETLYSGTKSITTDSYTSGFRLRENKNGVNIQTLNLSHTTNLSSAVDFTNSNTNWTNGSWAGYSQDRAALDAHWGAEQVFNYWSSVHGRNSIDNNGINVTSYVHYGNNIDNAYWDRTSRVMYYGDGNIFNPLVALDICAHEFGHGVNQFEANLGAGSGVDESDALNEGFSDIWGAVIENWGAPEKEMWRMGEELFSAGSYYNCIRNIQNPKSTIASEGQHPDTYQGNFWIAAGDAHYNSTVLSHWFYLLSEGSSATDGINDNNNTFSINGIGVGSAAFIAYQALSNYLTSSSNYLAAREATIQAAVDIFGVNSCEVKTVIDSWFAVGVGSAYNSNMGASISGSNVLCSLNKTFSLQNLPSGATVSWSASPSNLFSVTTGTGTNFSTAAATSLVSGQGTITATITTGACGNFTISKQVWIGKPGTPTITGPNPLCLNQVGTYQISGDYKGADQFLWSYARFTCVNNCNSNIPAIGLKAVLESGQVYVRGQNECGTSGMGFLYVAGCGSLSSYSVYPNPTADVLYISTNSDKIAQESLIDSNSLEQLKLNLYDFSGNPVLSKKLKIGSGIDIKELPKGHYILQVEDKRGTEVHHIIIE